MRRVKFDKACLSLQYLDHFPGMAGTGAVIAVYSRFPAPIGILSYRHTLRHHMEIVYVWTHEAYRRNGVATAMLAQLKRWYPTMDVCTAEGNRQSIPWLEKHGFENRPDGWFAAALQKRKEKAVEQPKKRPRRLGCKKV
jgi:ribosomal protein S18 acetylase RimI-like enzyme